MLAKFGEGEHGSNAVSFPLFCVRAVAAGGWPASSIQRGKHDGSNCLFVPFGKSNMESSGRKKTCCGRLSSYLQLSFIRFARSFASVDENGNGSLTVKSLLSRVDARFLHLCKIPYLRRTCTVNVGKWSPHCLPSFLCIVTWSQDPVSVPD